MSEIRSGKSRRVCLSVTMLCIGCLLAMSAPSAASLPVMWSDPVMIVDDGSRDVAVDGNSVYVMGENHVTVSHDSGATWSSAPNIYSRICADDGTIYRAFYDGGWIGVLCVDKSSDDGLTWSDPVLVLALEGGSDGSFGIFKFGSRLILYTMDGNPGGDVPGAMIKVAWSDDDGVTWSAPVIVDEGLYVEDPFPNDIVCANGVLYMTYYDQTPGYDNVEVIVAKSVDMGETWTNAVVAVGPNAHNPIIAADPVSGELYVTYLSMVVLPDWTLVDSGPFFLKSLDGVMWSVPIRVGTITVGTDQVGFHWLVASGGMVFEAYLDYKGRDLIDAFDVRISCSSNDGATWSDMGDVTGFVSNSLCPMLTIVSGTLHFFWYDCGTDNPWYVSGSTYHRSMPLVGSVIGEATVTRQSTGNPAKDAVTFSFSPDKDGKLWISATSNKLPVLKIEVYEKGTSGSRLVSAQMLVFGLKNTGPLEGSMMDVQAGQEYLVKLTPYGMVGASAEVTGLIIAG